MLPLIRILFPDYCTICKSYGTPLCAVCVWELPQSRLILPEGIYSSLSYRNASTAQLLKMMKGRKLPHTANLLARRMHDDTRDVFAELAQTKNWHSPIVIPIPQTTARHAERGYNHAELLANGFAHFYNENEVKNKHARVMTNVLTKTKPTHKQALVKNRQLRFENIRDSFSIAPTAHIDGECIILIDDITTTGATFLAAREILNAGGARHVVCISVAH